MSEGRLLTACYNTGRIIAEAADEPVADIVPGRALSSILSVKTNSITVSTSKGTSSGKSIKLPGDRDEMASTLEVKQEKLDLQIRVKKEKKQNKRGTATPIKIDESDEEVGDSSPCFRIRLKLSNTFLTV